MPRSHAHREAIIAFWDGWPEEGRKTGKRIVIGLGITLAVMMVMFWQSDQQMEDERRQTEPWAEMRAPRCSVSRSQRRHWSPVADTSRGDCSP